LIALEPDLGYERDLSGREPFGVLRLQAVEIVAGAPLDLAAFHRQADLGGALVAGHELEPGPDHAVHDGRIDDGVGAGAGPAHQHVALGGVRDRFYARRMPGVDRGIAGRGRGEPVEIGGVELNAFAAVQDLRHHEDRNEGRDDGAVPGGLAEDEIGRPDVAGARHVAWNDGRIARNVVGEMPRHYAGIGIETAPYPGADDQIDGLAPVVVGLRGGRCRRQHSRSQGDS
jgi:hypothetical protein